MESDKKNVKNSASFFFFFNFCPVFNDQSKDNPTNNNAKNMHEIEIFNYSTLCTINMGICISRTRKESNNKIRMQLTLVDCEMLNQPV